MMNNDCGEKYAGFFSLKWFRVLLAVIVFVAGITGNGIIEAASSVDKVVSEQQGATFNVHLKNVDLKAYAKYNSEIQKALGFRNMVLGKAAPGTTIEISTSPVGQARVFQSAVHFSVLKIAKDFPVVSGTKKEFIKTGNVVSGSYVIPNDAEIVSGYALLTYEDFTDANGKYWTVAGWQRNYYIFTSDEAFKKAYKMVTGKMLTGPISAPTAKNQSKNTVTQKKQNPENFGAGQQKNGAVESKRDTEKQESTVNKGRTYQQDDEDFDQDDLPDSDAAKAAAAVGTALGGGLLGAVGALGGIGGAAGGTGGAAGSVGGDYGGYDLYDDNRATVPDNLSVAEDGSIHIITPTGETLVYTPNADGSYNVPTHTESGEALTWQDEDGNWHDAEPGTLSQKEIVEGAQWYKDNEQAIIADRAEEDARQQAERERLAAENAAWLEEQREINNQKSWLSVELEKELQEMGLSEDNREFIEKMREKYAHGDKSLSKDEIKKAMKMDILKRNQIDQMMEGAYYQQEAAEWDDKLVTVQEVKFVADQAVNAYGMLTGNQAFATGYSALTNYTETMTDAVVFNKDKGKAFLKATIDTGLDAFANKLETKGWHVTGNAFSSAYKQVNDNVYNGRDAWEGADTATIKGGIMGGVSKGLGKLKEMSQGTALGREVGGTGTKPKVNTDVDTGSVKPKPKVDVGGSKPGPNATRETGGIRKTTIAERRAGQGQYKTNTPMSEADTKMQINEDVQANRSMNDVRKLNDISNKMGAMEKANPKTYQNDSEYQKLKQQFETQHKVVREDKVAIDRMNALQGKTGTDLRQRYNKADMEYENKVIQARNESITQETGLKTEQIGDFHATSNKVEQKLAGGPASHDLDTSPNVKVETGTGKNASVDFTQTDGDHHLVRGVYKAEHGRFPQNAAEYAEGQRLKELRDFTNVSTRPSDTHESYRNPDAYVGSGKGEVNKVLNPEKYGTPDKGTGVFNEQTAIHKQGTPLERHQQQYAEAQQLREQLKTDSNLSAAEKTEMGKKIATLERQSASNHYESTRTTVKEAKIIKGINDANVKNGLEGGMSEDAKQIGDWANQVKEGKMDNATYKKLVTEKFGSEENAQKIVAKGFRDTNK